MTGEVARGRDGVRDRTAARSPGLAGRLILAIAVVMLAAALTAWLVAGTIGPAIFRDHLLHSDVAATASAIMHAEEAFRAAGALSLGIALGVAALVALAVSALIARRIGASLTAVATAARDIADGLYDAEVRAPGLGTEFADLAQAFNHMSARLRASEALRRRLLSDIAHELRTPVATLDAQLESLEDGLTVLDEHTIALLRSQGARLTRLAEDLTSVTKAESGETHLEIRAEDPRALVVAAADAAGPAAASAGVTLTVAAAEGLPSVAVDHQRIAQVLGNLLDNAIRHTPAGGRVTVRALTDDTGVVLEVEDTGSGIATDHLPFVFERFYRADRARDRAHGGSGIGLAIVKAFVEAHGGTVTASSPGAGGGSVFRIRLPAAPAR